MHRALWWLMHHNSLQIADLVEFAGGIYILIKGICHEHIYYLYIRTWIWFHMHAVYTVQLSVVIDSEFRVVWW